MLHRSLFAHPSSWHSWGASYVDLPVVPAGLGDRQHHPTLGKPHACWLIPPELMGPCCEQGAWHRPPSAPPSILHYSETLGWQHEQRFGVVAGVLPRYSFPTSFALQVDRKAAVGRCLRQENTPRESFQNYPNYCLSRSERLCSNFLRTFHWPPFSGFDGIQISSIIPKRNQSICARYWNHYYCYFKAFSLREETVVEYYLNRAQAPSRWHYFWKKYIVYLKNQKFELQKQPST